MLLGRRTTHAPAWRFVLGCLHTKNNSSDPPSSVKILDTILMEGTGGGQPEAYFFTGGDGLVRRKAERHVNLKAIERDFLAGARGLPVGPRGVGGTKDEQVIAIAQISSGSYLPITVKDMRVAVKTGIMSAEFQCLYPFIPSKDYKSTGKFANYRYEYVLGDTGGGVPTGKGLRIIAAEVSGSISSQEEGMNTVVSRNEVVNTSMKTATHAIVVAIERVCRCRVLDITTEFVLDEFDELWLIGASTCTIAARPDPAVPPAPDPLTEEANTSRKCDPAAGSKDEGHMLATEKRSRHYKAQEDAAVLSDSDFTRLLDEVGYYGSGSTPACLTSPSTRKGRRRAKRRERGRGPGKPCTPDYRSVDEHPVGNSIGEGDDHKSTMSSLMPMVLDGRGTKNGGWGDGAPDSTSSATSPLGHKRLIGYDSSVARLDPHKTNKIFGSSQLEGCRGDFCLFDVTKRVREEEEHKLFATKVASAAGATGGDPSSLSQLRRKILALDGSDCRSGCSYSRWSEGGGGSDTSGCQEGVRPGGRGPRNTRHLDPPSQQQEIPYKAVVQARKEQVLVETFLRRYARGEDMDYVQGKGGGQEEQMLLGGRFPGVYYRPVKVCKTCYKVYKLIEDARTKALRRLSYSSWAGKSSEDHTPKAAAGEQQEPPQDEGKNGINNASEAGEDNGNIGDISGRTTGGNSNAADAWPEGEYSSEALSLAAAEHAIKSVTQGDVSEVRSFSSPPAVVEHVASAVMTLLRGEPALWPQAKAAMASCGFLPELREFNPTSVTHQQLHILEPLLNNPAFQPKAIRPLSIAASKLCLWVLGVVQSHRWLTGSGHERTNLLPPEETQAAALSLGQIQLQKQPLHGGHRQPGQKRSWEQTLRGIRSKSLDTGDLRLPSKLGGVSDVWAGGGERRGERGEEGATGRPSSLKINGPVTSPIRSSGFSFGLAGQGQARGEAGSMAVVGPRMGEPNAAARGHARRPHGQGFSKVTAQENLSKRLMNHDQAPVPGGQGYSREFLCSDGSTTLPYRVLGDMASEITCCNFVVIHDLFDNADKTEVLFKPITHRHRGCQVLTFNYPGQAGTRFTALASATPAAKPAAAGGPKPANPATPATSSGGASMSSPQECVANNVFMAPRLHELLQHVHTRREMVLTSPFHLVGIGNGVAIAAAFALRYGSHPLYRGSLRSLVSFNGFISVDSQLAAVLHASINAFESFPPHRPDLPVSYISGYIFSEEYLRRVGIDLALSIYTAVSNPISLEGRLTVCRSALLHKNLGSEIGALRVPTVILQATEDMLVNPANVDSFLRGRSTVHHFWSHEFQAQVGNGKGLGSATTTSNLRESSVSSGSVYSRKGLTGLLHALSRPRGAFVSWVPAGHEIRQEAKQAVLDLLDALAKPTPEHTGVSATEALENGGEALGLYPSANFVAKATQQGRDEALVHGKGTDAEQEGERDLEVGFVEATGEKAGGGRAPTVTERGRGAGQDEGGTGAPVGPEGMVQGATSAVGEGPELKVWKKGKQGPGGSGGKRKSPGQKRDFIGTDLVPTLPPRVSDPPGLAPLRNPIRRRKEKRSSGKGRDKRIRSTGELHWEMNGHRDGRRKTSGKRDRAELDPAYPETEYETEEEEAPADCGGLEEAVEEGTTSAAGFDLGVGGSYQASTLLYDMNPTLSSVGLTITAEPRDLSLAELSSDYLVSNEHQRAGRRWAAEDRAERLPKSGKGGNQGAHDRVDKTEEEGGSAHRREGRQEPTTEREGRNGVAASFPPLSDLLEAEACLEERLAMARGLQEERRREEGAKAEERIVGILEAQEQRREAFAKEDLAMVEALERELSESRAARAPHDLQQAVEVAALDDRIIQLGVAPPPPSVSADDAPPDAGYQDPVRPMPPLEYGEPEELPEVLRRGRDVESVLRDAVNDEREMREAQQNGDISRSMDLEEFQRKKGEAGASQAVARQAYLARSESDILRAKEQAALRVQPLVRGCLGRASARRQRLDLANKERRDRASSAIQAVVRGFLARRVVARQREAAMTEMILGGSARRVQSAFRGMLGRRRAWGRRQEQAALNLQRYCRGHLGRLDARRQRAMLEELKARNRAALRIQSQWRCKASVVEYTTLKYQSLAATEIQRVYRGHLGQKKAKRRRDWEQTQPGPQRLKLGVRLIEDSKVAFERQRLEINALHQAQEKAVVRSSRIHKELSISKQELNTLEREMHEVDHIEDELRQLTHERDLIQRGLISGNQKLINIDTPPTASPGGGNSEDSRGGDTFGGESVVTRADKASAYALEMQIQIKRAEREKKRR
ncbi:unnamed protein product, partial [Discosporangium mesarthrocarpum]